MEFAPVSLLGRLCSCPVLGEAISSTGHTVEEDTASVDALRGQGQGLCSGSSRTAWQGSRQAPRHILARGGANTPFEISRNWQFKWISRERMLPLQMWGHVSLKLRS